MEADKKALMETEEIVIRESEVEIEGNDVMEGEVVVKSNVEKNNESEAESEARAKKEAKLLRALAEAEVELTKEYLVSLSTP